MTSELPRPPVPADLDLSDLPEMLLDIERLRKSKSWLRARRRPELAFYMLNLWMRAFHDVPAGSIENDDDVLADAAGCHPRDWDKIKGVVLHGWLLCSDGRLYHSTVVEKVIAAFSRRITFKFDQEMGRYRQMKSRAKRERREPPPQPEFLPWLAHEYPSIIPYLTVFEPLFSKSIRQMIRDEHTLSQADSGPVTVTSGVETVKSAFKLQDEVEGEDEGEDELSPMERGEDALGSADGVGASNPASDKIARESDNCRHREDGFDRFWEQSEAPKRASKSEARKAWERTSGVRPSDDLVIAAHAAYRADIAAENERRKAERPPRQPHTLCHPVTFLNERRWEGYITNGMCSDTSVNCLPPKPEWGVRGDKLEVAIGEKAFRAWFSGARIEDCSPPRIIVPKVYMRTWIQNNFMQRLAAVFGEGVRVECDVAVQSCRERNAQEQVVGSAAPGAGNHPGGAMESVNVEQ